MAGALFRGLSAALEFGNKAMWLDYRNDLLAKSQREQDSWRMAEESERRKQEAQFASDLRVAEAQRLGPIQARQALAQMEAEHQAGFRETFPEKEQRERRLALLKAGQSRALQDRKRQFAAIDKKLNMHGQFVSSIARSYATRNEQGVLNGIPVKGGGTVTIADPDGPKALANVIYNALEANKYFTKRDLALMKEMGMIEEYVYQEINMPEDEKDEGPGLLARTWEGIKGMFSDEEPEQVTAQQKTGTLQSVGARPSARITAGSDQFAQALAADPEVQTWVINQSDGGEIMDEARQAIADGADPKAIIADIRRMMQSGG